MNAKVTVTCPMCGNEAVIEVDAESYRKWKHGVDPQDAFPGLTDDQREQLISGICPSCYKVAFPTE